MATLTNVISNATGNVGIGTTSTATKLQVYSTTGTAQIFNQLQLTNMGGGNNGDIVGIGFAAGESTQYGVKGSIGFVRTTSYGRGDITFYTNNTAGTETVSTSNERMRIDASGNLLIGKTDTLFTSAGTIIYPSSGLDVIRDGNPVLALNRLTSEGRIIDLYVATSLVGSICGLGGGGVSFNTSTTERMRITSDGNVGIGTTSPAYSIQSYGTTPAIVTGGTTYMGSAGQIGASFILRSENTSIWTGTREMVSFDSIGNGADHRIGGLSIKLKATSGASTLTEYFQINPTYGYTILPSGSVGIGTTSPSNKTTIDADATGVSFADNAVAQLVIRGTTDTTKRLGLGVDTTNNIGVIQAQKYGTAAYPLVLNPVGGNVGIGTNSPAGKLHISGSGQTIMRLDSSTTTNISQYMVKANTDGVLIMGMSGGSAASTSFGVTAAGQAYIGTTTLSTIHPTSLVIGNVSNIPIVFSTTNTEKARITPGGSLLVGTTVQAANTAGTAVATNFKGINAYEFNDTTGRGSTQGISWNYLINTTHIIDISPGDTVIAFIDVRLAAYSSSGSGYANSLFCYGGHVGAYNITTVFNVVYGNIAVSAAIVSDKLRITITIANSGQAGECVLTVTDANKNGTLSTIVRS